MEIRHPHEIEDREAVLSHMRRLARAPSAHLAVEDDAPGEPRHDEVHHLGAVETGIEHVHADEDLRVVLFLEPLDDGAGIGCGATADIADHEIGVTHTGMGFFVREVFIEHFRQRLRMPLRNREHDGLAPLRHPPDTVPAHEALLVGIAELPDQGAVALGYGELALQGTRVHRDRVRFREQFLELFPRLAVHRAPVEFIAADFESALGRGLHRHGPVDAVGHEMSFPDGPAQRIAEGRFGQPEEAQRVAHELAVLGVGKRVGIRRAGRGRQAELDSVEMPDHAAPLAVDRPVAFVGDHQVEIARRQVTVIRNQGLQEGDGDALVPVELPAWPQHMAGIVLQVVRESVLGLPGQLDPVDQEQDAGDDARLEQPLDESRRGTGLAGSRRHLHQQAAPPVRDFGGQGFDAFDLVVAVDDLPVDGHRGQIAAHPACGDPPLQVVLGIETRNFSGVGIRFPVQEPHFVAVRQENERDVELFGIVPSLVLRGDRIDAGPLGLQYRHRPSLPVAEHVIGLRAVWQRVFEKHARAVGQVPANIPKQGVDPDAGEGFGRVAHPVVYGSATPVFLPPGLWTVMFTMIISPVHPKQNVRRG